MLGSSCSLTRPLAEAEVKTETVPEAMPEFSSDSPAIVAYPVSESSLSYFDPASLGEDRLVRDTAYTEASSECPDRPLLRPRVIDERTERRKSKG